MNQITAGILNFLNQILTQYFQDMDQIVFKDKVYLVVDASIDTDLCIWDYTEDEKYLYGGRVKIIRQGPITSQMHIDGVPIIKIAENLIHGNLSFQTITAHLNAIENHGVDAFLDNYKNSLEAIYSALK